MSTSQHSHYFLQDLNQNDFQHYQQQQPQTQPPPLIPLLVPPDEQQQQRQQQGQSSSASTSTTLLVQDYESMMEQRTITTAMNTPDFGPLQANNLYFGRSSPSSPLLHHITTAHPSMLSQNHHHEQHEKKEERTRFVLRLAILMQRLYKTTTLMDHEGDPHSSSLFTSCYASNSAAKNHLLGRRVKQIVKYATQRNRLGDPRFTPLVESIERCLADLVGCDEWFSICLEAEQRHRVRKISETMMIVSSSMMLGAGSNTNNNLSSSSSSPVGTATNSPFKPAPSSNFPSSFFP